MCVGGTFLLFSFCIIQFCMLWLVSCHSKPAFPVIVFINNVSLLTPIEPAFTESYAKVVRYFDSLH